MNRTEIKTRLNRIQADCLASSIKARDALAAQFNAAHRLNSGAYFASVRDKVLEIESTALDAMAAFATSVLSAKEAASICEDHALSLHDELRQLINRTRNSEGGSHPAPTNAATQIRETFASKSASHRAAMLENIRHGLTAETKSEHGLMNFLKRNVTILIATAGLTVAIFALWKK